MLSLKSQKIKQSKVAVITGGASGIGFALSAYLIQKHIHVVLLDVHKEALNQAVDSLNATHTSLASGYLCDVADASAYHAIAKQIITKFKRIDYLFNNAGISTPFKPVWEMDLELTKQAFQINVMGVLHGIQAFMPQLMRQTHASHVVTMSSVYGLCSGSLLSGYAMTKHALVALTESLYFELKDTHPHIHVSLVCPSFMNTGLLSQGAKASTDPFQQQLASFLQHSRPVEDVAARIVRGVEGKQFYIFPDNEVLGYVEESVRAMNQNNQPFMHSLEKLVSVLYARSKHNS